VLRRPADSTESDAKLPGVIDTIGTAYAELNRRPYLIAIPVILDLYLWIGVRLSARPLTDFLEQWLQLGQSSNATALESVRTFGQQFDLFSLLTLTTPTLINDSIQVARLDAGQNPAISGLAWWMIPLLMVVLALIGIGIGMLYLTLIGYLVRGDRLTISGLIPRTFHNILRMYGFILVVFGLMLLVTIPVLIVGIILLSIGVNLMPMLAMLLMLASLWGVFLLFFAQDAIVVSDAAPVRAIKLSYGVVRNNFWPALVFIGAYALIRSGMPAALHVLTGAWWGVPLAVIGNAYIATGLVAAAMIFYRDRVRQLLTKSMPQHQAAGTTERSDTHG
jgi:hypothetical protein